MDSIVRGIYNCDDLTAVFGKESSGENPTERARTSTRFFARSQVQVTLATERATGRRLTAAEALSAFGWDALLQATDEGAFPLIMDAAEPAITISTRRDLLGLTVKDVSRASGLSESQVADAETPGKVSPIRTLERIAQTLALDERVIGYVPASNGDTGLGVRLRELTSRTDATRFSSKSVLDLSETAWVTSCQSRMADALGLLQHELASSSRHRDPNYAFPAWKRGFVLAARTRATLGLGADQPIESLRALVEEQLGIPLVQQSLNERFAGATIANRRVRGIVVNVEGPNRNVWIRRMTIAHELGHLLWDPDQRLNRLTVDDYDQLDHPYGDGRRDPVEVRANGFAISLLAPPDGVERLFRMAPDYRSGVAAIMTTFGVSASAAKNHIRNVLQLPEVMEVPSHLLPEPSDEWLGRENFTVDYFPLQDTPISRRGRFAWLVATACRTGAISEDSAAMLLRCKAHEVAPNLGAILSALTPEVGVSR